MRCGVWAPVWGSFLVRRETPDQTAVEASWAYNARAIQRAEQLGFATTLILDRSCNSVKGVGNPVLEAWTTAAALASVTNTIELIVANRTGFRHPGLVAQMAANIDHVSGGRLAINVVSGWWEYEFAMLGRPFIEHDDRYRMSSEEIEIMKGLWTHERLDYNGLFYQLSGASVAPKPTRKPWPRIYFGGESEPGRQLGAKVADCFLLNGRPLGAAKELVDDVRSRAVALGRALEFGMSCFVICRDSEREARAELERLGTLVAGHAPERPGVDPKAQHLKTSAASGGIGTNGGVAAGLIGTPEQLAERIQEFADLGIEVLLIQAYPLIEEMERFAAQVMPRLGPDSVGTVGTQDGSR